MLALPSNRSERGRVAVVALLGALVLGVGVLWFMLRSDTEAAALQPSSRQATAASLAPDLRTVADELPAREQRAHAETAASTTESEASVRTYGDQMRELWGDDYPRVAELLGEERLNGAPCDAPAWDAIDPQLKADAFRLTPEQRPAWLKSKLTFARPLTDEVLTGSFKLKPDQLARLDRDHLQRVTEPHDAAVAAAAEVYMREYENALRIAGSTGEYTANPCTSFSLHRPDDMFDGAVVLVDGWSISIPFSGARFPEMREAHDALDRAMSARKRAIQSALIEMNR